MGSILKSKFRNKNQSQSALFQPINQTNNTVIQSISLPPPRDQVFRTQSKLQKQMQLTQRSYKQNLKWYEKVYFTPQSKFIILLKSVTLVLIYLYFVQIPITIAFQKHRNQDQSQRLFQRINIPAIVVFIIGVLIKLKTAFYRQGILISDQKQVLINYLLYIFIFDFLSITSIVVYQFAQILRDRVYNKDPLSYRFIVLLFYLKAPQLFDIEGTIIASFDLNRRVKAFLKLILLMGKIFIICNIAACCFFYISDTTCPMNQQSPCPTCCWIYLEKLGGPIKYAQWNVQYAFSLYWASTTMLTIGYGDITPQNLPQAVYTISAQFISCVIFAFSINEIWSIIQQKNSKRFKIHSRMNIINVYMRDKNVSPQLKSRVNAYLSHFYHTKNLRQKQLEHQIISQLTPSLRKQLFYQSYGFLFKTHMFFDNFTSYFLEEVSQYIRQVGFFEQEIVYQPQSQQQISLYYIHKGQLQSYIQLGNSRTRNVTLQQFEKGAIVGLFEFVRQINYCSSLMALKYTLLYVLDYNNWINCVRQYDQDFQVYYKLKHNSQYQQKYKKLNLLCRLCGSQKHQPDMCLKLQIQSKSQGFLANYLRRCQRMPYIRRNFKTNLDIKSQHFQFQPILSPTRVRVRKGSISLRKDSLKQQPNKKKIFHKKTHHQKMNVIIEKKMKQSIWSSSNQSDGQILSEVVLSVDSVQNYEYYWPIMNATSDLSKDRRRATFNRILIKE